MITTRVALAAALLCTSGAGSATAQALRQPASIQRAAYTTDYYSSNSTQDQTPSPSDVPIAPSTDAGASCAPACGNGCDDACECEPWNLFPQRECGWNVTGWIDAGITGNAQDPVSNYNGPLSFNDRNEIQLNQLYAVLEKKLDTGGCGFDWGGRVDLLYGTDYIFTQAAGLETRRDFSPKWNSHTFYGLAMPQVYLDFGYNDLSIKLGHFYTIIGYEVVTAPGNFFYSHAYTMQYGEPFTHTGGLGTWKYNDRWTFYAGLVNGWDKLDALSNQTSFLGGATYTPDHERYTFTATVITGLEDGAALPLAGNRTMYSLVFSYNVTDNLQYVLQHDNGLQQNGAARGEDAEWYGINQYLLYSINDCWKVGGRFEWFRDDDGVRVTGIRATNPLGGESFEGNFYELTLGLNWTPRTNLTVRPEVRWDWFDGIGTVADPYDDNNSDDQFTAAIDAILTF